MAGPAGYSQQQVLFKTLYLIEESPFSSIYCLYYQAKKLQYNGSINFKLGDFGNTSFLSWGGPSGDLNFAETMNTLYTSGTENIVFVNHSTNVQEKYTMKHGICKILATKSGLDYLNIMFKKGVDYSITVSDPNFSSHFQLSDDLMQGDKILTKPYFSSETEVFTQYKIVLEETITEANYGTCTVYPNQQYHNFTDCFDEEMRKKILPVLGCMIPWTSPNDWCTGLIQREGLTFFQML